MSSKPYYGMSEAVFDIPLGEYGPPKRVCVELDEDGQIQMQTEACYCEHWSRECDMGIPLDVLEKIVAWAKLVTL